MPALATAMSSPPKVSTVRWTADFRASASVTSASTHRCSGPSSSASAASRSGSSPTSATRAPRAAAVRASAAPIPRAAPVISTERPASVVWGFVRSAIGVPPSCRVGSGRAGVDDRCSLLSVAQQTGGEPVDAAVRDVRVAVIGSGFAGLGMAIALRNRGEHDFVVLERAHDVGGTWRDNSYPGAACDVQSHLYSFSFAPNPDWPRSYSAQPEIQAYLRGVAERYDVRRHVLFGAEVRSARWIEADARWHVRTAAGDVRAQVLVSAAGALADPTYPDIPGLASFEGTVMHSACWDHTHDLAGERVAVIGTGASAIQVV